MGIATSRTSAVELDIVKKELRSLSRLHGSPEARLWPNPVPVISATPTALRASLDRADQARWGLRFLGEIDGEPVCLDFARQTDGLTFSALLPGAAAREFLAGLSRADRYQRAKRARARLRLVWFGAPGRDALVLWTSPATAVVWPLVPRLGRMRGLSRHLALVESDVARFAARPLHEQP